MLGKSIDLRTTLILGLLALLAILSPALAASAFDEDLHTGQTFELQVVDPEVVTSEGQPLEYTVRGTVWEPREPSEKPVIVYNHGLQSHQGWYFTTGEELAALGFPVVAFDRIGSGASDPGAADKNGALQRSPGHITSWRLFVDTLDRVVRFAGERFPGREIAVWGNSYGAKVVTAYLFDHAEDLAERRVKHAIYTVPGLFQNKQTMPLAFSKLRLVFSSGMHLFPVPMVEVDGDNGAAWFIGPGEHFDRIQADELSLREATRRFWLQTRSLDRFIAKQPETTRLPVPAFFLMVQGDRLMDNRKMQDFIVRRAGEGSFAKLYSGGEGAKHFLLFTEDREAALADIRSFVQGRSSSIEGSLP